MTYKEIKTIIEKTKKEIKGTCASIETTLGAFRPKNANWAYLAGWTHDGDLVVTRFGRIL